MNPKVSVENCRTYRNHMMNSLYPTYGILNLKFKATEIYIGE